MSGLSLWQQAQVIEAIHLLNRAYRSVDLSLSADPVDEKEDYESLENSRSVIGRTIGDLEKLLD